MPIPDYQTLMLPVLKCVADGELHPTKEIYQKVAEMLQLSDEERAERLPSGVQSTFENRVGWARTYLKRISINPNRHFYLITHRSIFDEYVL